MTTFQLDPETRRQLGERLIAFINQYFDTLTDRQIQRPADQRAWLPLQEPMPEVPQDPAAVLDSTIRDLVDHGFHVGGANYFGLMNPTPAYMAVLGEALSAALNPPLATIARSQLPSHIEHECVRWIAERLGWIGRFNGSFTSGGAEANFSSIALALVTRFPDVINNGIRSLPAQPVFYTSSEGHHSLDKAAGLLGLGRQAIRRVPVTDRMQFDVNQLEDNIARDRADGHLPFCVCATAGTTSSGAVDDIAAIADACRRHELWLHVDGAYGGAVIFSDHARHLVRGIEHADSVALDPHKWLAMPFTAGVVVTQHPEALRSAFEVTAPYVPRPSATATLVDNYRISMQWSRRLNALKFWLTLKVHGRRSYEQLIDRQIELAHDFACWVESTSAYELAAPQVLPIVNFRLKMRSATEPVIAAAHATVVEAVNRDGSRWISATHVGGRSALRMMAISYLTEQRHVEGLQDALVAAARGVAAGKAVSS